MKRIVAVVILIFAFSLMALAHGKEKHVMGKVTSISDSSITVETTAKKPVTVEVSEKTKFEKSGSPATLKDLKVGDKVVVRADVSGDKVVVRADVSGDKVVVRADVSGDKLVANEVHFGAMKAKQPMEGMKGMESMDHK